MAERESTHSMQTQTMADTVASTTVTVAEDTQDHDVPTLTLKLRKPKPDKKVMWTTETVDNEDMNKKKSKCCCIYDKPRKFDDSSSDSSDEECEHCLGHVDKKKKHKHNATVTVDSAATTAVETVPVPQQSDPDKPQQESQ